MSSKTFAEGEILTAQDVNEYLVNQVTRTVLTGLEVFTPATGVSMLGATAIIDTDADGSAAVSFTLDLSGTNLPAGNQVTPLGTLTAACRPTVATAFSGFNSSRVLVGSVLATGVVAARWTSAAMPSGGTVISASTVRIAG